jgi:membrane protein YqaA with SNARE-associated domain
MLETIKKKKPGSSKKPKKVLKNNTSRSYTREELEKKNMKYILKKEREKKARKRKGEKYFNTFITSLSAAVMSVVGGASTACSAIASYPFRAVAAGIAIGGFIYLISKLFG